MINVYPSVLPGDPVEIHEVSGLTVGDWMTQNVPGYLAGDNQPVSVTLNGELLAPRKWASALVGIDDVADIRVQPAGASLAVAFKSLQEVFRPIVNALTPDIPNQRSPGQSLDFANSAGNAARLGQSVPESFGSLRVYPDFLLPPARRFESKRVQSLRMFLCVGVGIYDIGLSDVRVGDTSFDLLDDASYTVYGPNENVSADPSAEFWHNVEEVGSTSAGGAGIDLGGISGVTVAASASAYTFSGTSIFVPSGAGEFPSDWNSTLTVRVEQYFIYSIESGGARDVIRGNLDQIGLFAGMLIEIAGDNSDLYKVHSFTASVPDAAGSASILTGSAAPATYDFSVTSATFSVLLDGDSQSITVNTNVVNLAGLLAEINSQLDPTVEAEDSAGKVRLVEQGPSYSGASLIVTGDTVDIFGSSPVSVDGDETTVSAEAELTLSYDNGDPVVGFSPALSRMAIGYRGMLYSVVAADSDEIELGRLDDTGAPDLSWAGFDTETTTDAVISVASTSASVGWSGPFTACPDGQFTDEIEFDTFFPQGLSYTKDSGSLRGAYQSVELQWRDTAIGGAWNSVVQGYFQGTYDQIGFSHSLSLPYSMNPQVRMRRRGPGSAGQYRLNVQWYGLRARLAAPASYPWTTISVNLSNANRISSQSENKINVMVARKLPTLIADVWQPAAVTRDIAPVIRYIAQSIGYTDDQIDMEELARLNDVWNGRGDHFDMSFSETTVADALKSVLRAGMSDLTVDAGRIQAVRDEPRTTFESGQGYSPQNMTSPLSRSFKSRRPDDADGVDVEFTNRDSWAKETIECRMPGDLGLKVEKISLDGVTDRAQAYQIGMRRRASMRYRRWEYSFSTEMDGLNSSYMSYVPILDDLPRYGQSSIMKSIQDVGGGDAKITVTEPMDWSDVGASYVVAYRRPDGTVVGPFAATMGADEYQIIAAIPLPWPDLAARQEPPHVYFGTTENWCFPALITSIRPSGLLSASVTATNYDERVYQYDNATPPA